MIRIPKGTMVLGSLALAGAAGLLVVTVLRAVSVDPVGEATPAADGEEVAAVLEAPAEQEADAVEALEAPAEDTRRSVRATVASGGRVIAALEGSEQGPPGAWDDPLALAVDNDPFNPRRQAPNRRYQLPSEREPVAREESRERPEAPDFRIVGAAVAGKVGLALVQIDRDEPRLLVMGESLQGYELAAVDGESATLVGPAGSLRYPVMEPLAPRRRDEDDRRRRGDNNNERGREQQEQQLQRLEQMQNVMQRFQGDVRIQRIGDQIRLIRPGGGGGE